MTDKECIEWLKDCLRDSHASQDIAYIGAILDILHNYDDPRVVRVPRAFLHELDAYKWGEKVAAWDKARKQ